MGSGLKVLSSLKRLLKLRGSGNSLGLELIHVVTLVSPDGRYGGPLRVAMNQVRFLDGRGGRVTLVAGAVGFGGELPESFEGVPVKLFRAYRVIPGQGFAGVVAPGMLLWMIRNRARMGLVHLHLARDLVMLPASGLLKFLKIPLVVQSHGMIVESRRVLAVPLDRYFTRPVLQYSRLVLALTKEESQQLAGVGGSRLNLKILPNGVTAPEDMLVRRSQVLEILFVGRLHPVKNPIQFVEMADRVLKRRPGIRFALIGPDEGEAANVTRMISDYNLGNRVVWEGALSPEQLESRMAEGSVLVSTSLKESFGMAIIEAMSFGIPVVIPHSLPIGSTILDGHAGVLYDGSTDDLVDKLLNLLSSRDAIETMGHQARQLVIRNYSADAVGMKLMEFYQEVDWRLG